VKKISVSFFLTLITFHLSICIYSQENDNKSSEFSRNSINGYIGLVDYNINFERNIIQLPESYSNLRIGVGLGAFVTAGEGIYLNPSFVHLIGKRRSHLELDLGFKYIVSYLGLDPKYSKFFIPDFFAGYRYEQRDGGIIFRLGLNWPTLINIGIGVKL
jgi:hypothetical protein